MDADEIRVARIDVVATILGRDEQQWLEVTTLRPTFVAHVEGAARFGGCSAIQGEKKEKREQMGTRRRSARTRGSRTASNCAEGQDRRRSLCSKS